MDYYHISGRNMTVGSALTEYVTTHIKKVEKKYFGEAISGHVVFHKMPRGIRFECSIRLICNRGNELHSVASGTSAYAAFNDAIRTIDARNHRIKVEKRDTKPINVAKVNLFNEHEKPEVFE